MEGGPTNWHDEFVFSRRLYWPFRRITHVEPLVSRHPISTLYGFLAANTITMPTPRLRPADAVHDVHFDGSEHVDGKIYTIHIRTFFGNNPRKLQRSPPEYTPVYLSPYVSMWLGCNARGTAVFGAPTLRRLRRSPYRRTPVTRARARDRYAEPRANVLFF